MSLKGPNPDKTCPRCGGRPELTLHPDGSTRTAWHRCPVPVPGPPKPPRWFKVGEYMPNEGANILCLPPQQQRQEEPGTEYRLCKECGVEVAGKVNQDHGFWCERCKRTFSVWSSSQQQPPAPAPTLTAEDHKAVEFLRRIATPGNTYGAVLRVIESLRAALKLAENHIVAHHEGGIMREGVHTCPICADFKVFRTIWTALGNTHALKQTDAFAAAPAPGAATQTPDKTGITL